MSSFTTGLQWLVDEASGGSLAAQDSSISFEDYADSTSSQEDELEDWIEYIKRGMKEAW